MLDSVFETASTMSAAGKDGSSTLGKGRPRKGKTIRTPYVNLYCFDSEKCKTKLGKDSFDGIIKSHEKIVAKKPLITKEISCAKQTYITKCTKVIYAADQEVQTQTQVEAKLKKTKNAFSIWYFEGKDGNIYVAGEGRSFHYIRDLTDHNFPEKVFDRHLDEDVLELHGQKLLGRVALYSETYRQVHRILDNLWQYLNSLTMKMKVAVRDDSELRKSVLKDDKNRVFVDVNFQNNSVQIKKALKEDELVEVLNILVRSFERPSSSKCALLRLVSRVRDDPTRQKLNKRLSTFLAQAGTRTGGSPLSETQVVDPIVLNAFEDAWNSTTEIVLKLPTVQETPLGFDSDRVCKGIQGACDRPEDVRVRFQLDDGKTKVVSGKDYIDKKHHEIPATMMQLKKPEPQSPKVTYQRHKESSSTLFGGLYQKFTETCKHFDFLYWLERVVVEYGEKKRKEDLPALAVENDERKRKKDLLSLVECRQQFPLESKSYMYFHGEWLSFHPRFHSLLEVHFLELMKTRSIDSNLILPIPWPHKGLNDPQKNQFVTFFASWLRHYRVTNEAAQTLERNSTYKVLRESLGSDMTEPDYNEMYLLVDKLMEADYQRDQLIKIQKRGFLVGDGVTLDGGMELFDLMYYDELNVFFIHVKKSFNTGPMQQVVDQVRHSAEYMQCLFLKGRGDLETEMHTFLERLKSCEVGGDKKRGDKTGDEKQGGDKTGDTETVCPRHKNIKWACDRNRKCAQKFDAKTFVELLTTHKFHFVLAYGGGSKDDLASRIVEGKEIENVLKQNKAWIPKLEEEKYITRVPKEERKPFPTIHVPEEERNPSAAMHVPEEERNPSAAMHVPEEERSPSAAKDPRRDEDSYALTRRFCMAELENFLQDMKHQNSQEMKDLEKLFRCLKSAISKTELNACKMTFLNLFESFKNMKDMTLWFCKIDHRSPDDKKTKDIVAKLENVSSYPRR